MVDPASDFYKAHGKEVLIRTINGDEHRPSFVYPGFGEFRSLYGARQFPVACSGTALWRDTVFSQLELMQNTFDPDSLFVDCYGAAPTQPCFNDAHEHGARIDREWPCRRKFFDRAVAYCNGIGKPLATEIATDIAASYTQFIHSGLGFGDLAPNSEQFPALFRYTFPEVIVSNRGVRNAEGEFAKKLRNCLVYGIRYDAEEWPLPRIVVSGADEVARVIRETAMAEGIPIMENVPLARALYAEGKIGEFVPESLLEPVAEVLQWVKRLSDARKEEEELDSVNL
jgi:type III secretion system FlhB-like substrate exporter